MDMWDIHNTLTDLGDKPLANRVIVDGLGIRLSFLIP